MVGEVVCSRYVVDGEVLLRYGTVLRVPHLRTATIRAINIADGDLGQVVGSSRCQMEMSWVDQLASTQV